MMRGVVVGIVMRGESILATTWMSYNHNWPRFHFHQLVDFPGVATTGILFSISSRLLSPTYTQSGNSTQIEDRLPLRALPDSQICHQYENPSQPQYVGPPKSGYPHLFTTYLPTIPYLQHTRMEKTPGFRQRKAGSLSPTGKDYRLRTALLLCSHCRYIACHTAVILRTCLSQH